MLEAAFYYANNFDKVKEVVSTFDSENAYCIEIGQNNWIMA